METKDIYGIYDMKNSEQCVYVGELKEIFKILRITPRSSKKLIEAIKNETLVLNRYEVHFLFKEYVEGVIACQI